MAEELKPVYLITGGDRPKVDTARARLRNRFDPDAVEHLTAEDDSGDDAVAACNALGLFGGGARLVLVEVIEKWKAPDVKAVVDYLGSPAPGTVLALVGEGLKADGPLGKACAKAGTILVYDVPKNKLFGWVSAQFKAAGAQAGSEACRALVEIVGEDTYALAGEVEKIAVWAGGEPITPRDVEQLAVGASEAPPWTLTDALGRRDVGAALGALETSLERGDGSRAGTLAKLANSIESHVVLIRACQRFSAEGISVEVATKRLGKRSSYPVKRAYAQAPNFTEDELRSAVVRMAELDLALKGGSRLAGELELSRALVDVTRPAAAPAG